MSGAFPGAESPGAGPDPRPVHPAPEGVRAVIRPPGSKSITCRAYVLAALAEGESRISGALRAEDTDRLLEALRTLGARAAWEEGQLVFQGAGGRLPGGGEVNLGDGGTPTRFVIAAACLASAPTVVDGSPRMRERPVAEGIELLRRLGAEIECLEAEGRLPVRVHPSPNLRGGRIEVGATASSQFISALLLIAPFLPQGLEIVYRAAPTSASYLALTRAVLRDFGVQVEDPRWIGPRRDVAPATRVQGRAYAVEPDASSAAYWLVAAAMLPGAEIAVEGLAAGSPQPDIGLLEVLGEAGVRWTSTRRPPTIAVAGPSRLRGLRCGLEHMPDGAMAVAVLAACADGPSELSGLHTLRVKETDRIEALAQELRRVGCQVRASDDGLRIDPPPGGPEGPPAVIQTYGDHRVAMAFAVLGLRRPGIAIADPGCVAKSYPGFWEDLARVEGSAEAR